MKKYRTILGIVIVGLSILVAAVYFQPAPQYYNMLDKAAIGFDRLLGRTTLVCETNKFKWDTRFHGLDPRRTYIFKFGRDGLISLDQYFGNKSHEVTAWKNPRFEKTDSHFRLELATEYWKKWISINRYTGYLSMGCGNGYSICDKFSFPEGECLPRRFGAYKSNRQF